MLEAVLSLRFSIYNPPQCSPRAKVAFESMLSATWKVEMRQGSIRFPPLSARWQTERPTYSRDTHIAADALADRAPPSVIKKV
jgi:hypothetical protein